MFSLLKGRDSDGFSQNQETFIHNCIMRFPYCDTTLLQQLVKSIAPVGMVSTLLASSIQCFLVPPMEVRHTGVQLDLLLLVCSDNYIGLIKNAHEALDRSTPLYLF